MNLKLLLYSGALLATALPVFAAEIPKAPVPVSPFIRVVYGYADAMLKNGRDKNGLFHSALDRSTLAPLTNRPAPPSGVRLGDRVGTQDGPLIGSNPYHDENLLRLLSTLTDLSAKPHYRAAADAELKWFVENMASSSAEQLRPWMLWDRCFEIAPEASKRSLLGLSQQEIAFDTLQLQRSAGFKIRAFATAYAHTRDEQFTRVIADLVARWQEFILDYTPSLVIDLDGSANRLPEPMASNMRAKAMTEKLFLSVPHEIKESGGFVTDSPRLSLSKPNPRPHHTPLWKASHGTRTTAQVGMMCVSRYDNNGDVRHLDLIFAAADAYLASLPADDDDAWPATFGHAISLELAAWRHSANWKYMERARKLGDTAVEKFWGTNALPRASLKTNHYEAVTGADTLALALLELHLQILHITAVRCPPNTIDR